jgi:Lecithin retinol acyltransferase
VCPFKHADTDKIPMSKRERWPLANGLQTTDSLVVGDQEPPLGSHLVTARRVFLHHGIYVGGGRVVHYSGLAQGLHGGPVKEVPLGRFAAGWCVWIRPSTLSRFSTGEVVSRARSRLGEDNYRLLTNNCEHFCEWCLRGTPRSLQVEAWVVSPCRLLQVALRSSWQAVSLACFAATRGLSNAIKTLGPPVRGAAKHTRML